jgi:hypothetical protein
MRSAAILFTAVAALSSSAQAQLAPEIVTILAVRDAGGWRLDAEVEGTGITSASFTPPGRPALDVPCESDPGLVLCERVEPAPPSAGFATLAALLTQFPAGSWPLSVNGGALTVTLPFAPVEPDGVVTVTDPADSATNVSTTPDVSYQNTCASCTFLEFRIEDAATGGEVFEISTILFGPAPLPSSGQLYFEDFGEGPPTPLPIGEYGLIAAAGIGALETRSFDQGGDFEYGAGASLQTYSLFSVPEPDAGALVASAALLGLARRRYQTVEERA